MRLSFYLIIIRIRIRINVIINLIEFRLRSTIQKLNEFLKLKIENLSKQQFQAFDN